MEGQGCLSGLWRLGSVLARIAPGPTRSSCWDLHWTAVSATWSLSSGLSRCRCFLGFQVGFEEGTGPSASAEIKPSSSLHSRVFLLATLCQGALDSRFQEVGTHAIPVSSSQLAGGPKAACTCSPQGKPAQLFLAPCCVVLLGKNL